MPIHNDFYPLETLEITLTDIFSPGWILDIGGGGEGVIGQLRGRDVVAIDIKKEELLEANNDALKIVMDACELKFLDCTFTTATMFFSLMYMQNEVQRKALAEAWRVLKPGSSLHVWDVDLSGVSIGESQYYAVPLQYKVNGQVHQSGYGRPWPAEVRDEAYYVGMSKEAGFTPVRTERIQYALYMVFEKR